MRFLHISDFHCFGTPNQHLRDGFFDEYVTDLCNQVLTQTVVPSFVIATGDFAHKYSKEGFKVARLSIQKICENLSIPKENVFVVPGNHDYDRDLQKSKDFKGARLLYESEISQYFGPAKTFLHESVWHADVSAADGIVSCLGIDSTWGNENCVPPSAWPSDLEKVDIRDKIVNWVKSIPPENTLVVLSHYPINIFDALAALDKEPDYAKNHLASGLEPLRRRINENRRESVSRRSVNHGPTIWFHGDVHKAQVHFEHPSFYSIAGRLDSPIDPENTTGIRRNARMVSVSQPNYSNETPKKWQTLTIDFEWAQETHTEVMDLGGWKAQVSETFPKFELTGVLEGFSKPQSSSMDVNLPVENQLGSNTRKADHTVVVELDFELSESIVDFIALNRLLRLERHSTGENWERLTHIDLGPLMTDSDLVGAALLKFGEWFRNSFDCESTSTGIIGVDVWGSAIASELGVRTGTRSIGMTLRGADDSYAAKRFGEDIASFSSEPLTHAVLVSDVIVTGETLARAYKMAIDAKVLSKESNVHGLAIIAPSTPRFRAALPFLVEIQTCCSQIPFVVVRNSELPTDSILRPDGPVRFY